MAGQEITEEDIMNNDIDPIDGLREIRRGEGVPEDELPMREAGTDHDLLAQEAEDTTAETEDDYEETHDESTDSKPDAKEDTDAGEAEEEETLPEDGAEEEVDTADEEVPMVKKFRANGADFEFTQEEINEQFETVFGKAMDYTQKMQKISPYRKMISALEQEGVTQDHLNLALDALKGDKGAIKKILENNQLDSYDLSSDDDTASPYNPTSYGKDEVSLEIEEVISTIQNDEEFRITTNVIDDQWDSPSRQIIAKNPRYIQGLHNDIKSGLYDRVAPAAMKMKVLDGHSKSDIEYYMIAGEQLRLSMEAEAKVKEGQAQVDKLNEDAQSADSKFDKASSQANRKRAASSTGQRADRKGVIDYLDDDDEAYDEWYKNLQSKI